MALKSDGTFLEIEYQPEYSIFCDCYSIINAS